jgi:hypothetical protein
MTTTSSLAPDAADPIDMLVPAPRPWWMRLAAATVTVVVVGVVGYAWHFGLVRPSPDCCGSGSSGTQIGLAAEPDAVTLTAYFFNSSPRAVSIVGASADLPGATVLGVAPFTGPGMYQIPPSELADLPLAVEGHGDVWLAVTMVPERCTDDAGDWGTVRLELEVGDDPWYPTFGRSFELPDPLVPAGSDQLGILPPERLDGAFDGVYRPLEAACILLGR